MALFTTLQPIILPNGVTIPPATLLWDGGGVVPTEPALFVDVSGGAQPVSGLPMVGPPIPITFAAADADGAAAMWSFTQIFVGPNGTSTVAIQLINQVGMGQVARPSTASPPQQPISGITAAQNPDNNISTWGNTAQTVSGVVGPVVGPWGRPVGAI